MKAAQLVYDTDGDRLTFDGEELHCGDTLEVLICNGLNGRTEWIETRLEYDDDWYLIGLLGYQVSGLFARR